VKQGKPVATPEESDELSWDSFVKFAKKLVKLATKWTYLLLLLLLLAMLILELLRRRRARKKRELEAGGKAGEDFESEQR
jgi:preprotein translocase subunit SecG